MWTEQEARTFIVECGWRLSDLGLVAGTDGNISARISENRLLVTPSGVPKRLLEPEMMIATDLDGKVLDGTGAPSTEIAMHLAVMKQRPDVVACVHAHPPFATSFAVAGEKIPYGVLPEAVLFLGDVPLARYAPPGTEAVPNELSRYVSDHDAFLMQNHGALTVGRTGLEALNRMETLEHTAQILHSAHQLGQIVKIPSEDLKRLEQMRATYRTSPPVELGGAE